MFFLSLFFGFLSISYATGSGTKSEQVFTIGSIPDQSKAPLAKAKNLLSLYLSHSLKVKVKYVPAKNYADAVNMLLSNKIDMAWLGGFTAALAYNKNKLLIPIAQRAIDAHFRSVFIANSNTKIKPSNYPSVLEQLKNKSFSYGNRLSTSGRLMPQYYLKKAGVKNTDFSGGKAHFSKNHSQVIDEVLSGKYQTGAVNEQILNATIDKDKKHLNLIQVYITPEYTNYMWVAKDNLDSKFYPGFEEKLQRAFLNLKPTNSNNKQILKFYGAHHFIKVDLQKLQKINQITSQLGLENALQSNKN